MDKVRIDRLGATYLIGMTIMAKMFTPEPRMLALKLGNSAWLVVFLSGFVALFGYWFLIGLLKRFPGQALGTISRQVWGNALGRLVTLIYFAYFVFLAGVALREFVSGFRLAIVPQTPPGALTMIYMIVVVHVSMKGIETLARLVAYLTPVLIGLFLFTIVAPYKVIDLQGLFPIMGNGVGLTLAMPFPESSLFSEVIILGVMAGLLKPKEVNRVGLSALIGGLIGQTAAWIIFSAIFPYPMIARLSFPMLEVVRLIELSEILQRMEALFVFLWFFIAAFKLTLLMDCAALLFMEISDLPDYRPLILPLAAMIYTISFLPANEVSLVWLDSYSLRLWSWLISYLLPGLTLGLAFVRRKRGVMDGALPTSAG